MWLGSVISVDVIVDEDDDTVALTLGLNEDRGRIVTIQMRA